MSFFKQLTWKEYVISAVAGLMVMGALGKKDPAPMAPVKAAVAAPAPKTEFQQALERAHWGKAEQDAANDRRREAEGRCDLFKLGNKPIPDDCTYRGAASTITITVRP
jgi:hypothetical protein